MVPRVRVFGRSRRGVRLPTPPQLLPMAALSILVAAATAAVNAAAAAPGASWHDATLTAAARTESLIADLTLNEKVSLLQVSQPSVERIGLPGYDFGRECERGDTSGKVGTAYPTGSALGGTFDVELVHAIAVATAIEVRGNVNTDNSTFGASCFGPVSNLVRDPRWGRIAEMVTGEDPQLGRLMSRAYTWGMQQRYDQSSPARMLNTIAKHLNTCQY